MSDTDNSAPILSGADPSTDANNVTATVLSGGATDPGAGVNTTAAVIPQQQPQSQPAAPDVQTPGVSAQAAASIPQSAPAQPPPQAAGQPSVWKNLVMGAIYGLAGSAGSTHFGGGLARGAAGYMQGKQQEVDNANTAKQLQFESVKAADSHIDALNRARAADDEDAEAKQRLSDAQDAAEEVAEERGMKPKLTIKSDSSAGMHAQATGGMTTLAQQNGGTIPQVTTTNSPATAGDPTHTVYVYSTSPQDVTNNPNGVNKLINDARAVQGLAPLSDSDIQIAGGQRVKGNWRAGVAQMVNDAQNQLFQAPMPSKKSYANNEGQSENAAIEAHMQQQLDTYQQSPNADPQIVKLLQKNLAVFHATAESARARAAQGANSTKLENAPANAEATRQEDQAKADVANDPANQAAAARGAGLKTEAEERGKQSVQAQGTDYKPGATADQKKKADLGNNVAENAATINSILARRPDLVGKIQGHITNTEQMIGNDDPDIAALGQAAHNIAMANVGIHGMRSNDAVQETSNLILNNLKNGPNAVAGALKATTDSLQTFEDAARPDTSPFHSKNGGAYNYYAKQRGLDTTQQSATPAPTTPKSAGVHRGIPGPNWKPPQPATRPAGVPSNAIWNPGTKTWQLPQ